MNKPILLFTLFFSIFCFYVFTEEKNLEQDDFRDFEELSLEDLLKVEVVTASKRPQKLSEAPAAIYVINEEDIRQSGATNIPDILRVVPGLDVMQITASQTEINPRGFCEVLADKLLVLIDGRTVYNDFLGGTSWETFPINLEEIKSIEVIRGPSSAVWGANALSGVINIITKTPHEMQGLFFSQSGGEKGFVSNSLIYSKVLNKLGYKLSAGWKKLDEFKDAFLFNSDKESEDFWRMNLVMEYEINEESFVKIEGGIWDGEIESRINPTPQKFNLGASLRHIKVECKYGNFQLQVFRNMGEAKARFLDIPLESDYKFRTYDFEFKHFFSLGKRHTLTWGLNYRLASQKSDYLEHLAQRNLFAVFLQEKFSLFENLSLVLGARLDDEPLYQQNLSHNTAILYSPFKNHTLRLQTGTAFKSPSIYDSEAYFLINPFKSPSPDSPFETQSETYWIGNQNLSPEKITAYQLGYIGSLGEINLGLDLFYNKVEKIIGVDSMYILEILIDPVTGQPILDPETGRPIPTKMGVSPTNHGKVNVIGAEFWTKYQIIKGLTGLFNYSYQELTDKNTNQRMKSSPSHKVNLGIRFKHKSGFSTNWLFHYVSQIEWLEIGGPNPGPERYVKVDPYVIVNLRFGYSLFKNRAEIFLAAFNAFNHKHLEYFQGEEIARRISGGFRFKL